MATSGETAAVTEAGKNDSSPLRKYLKIAFKFGLSVGLVALLIYKIGLGTIWAQLAAAKLSWLAISIAILLISNVLQAWQWKLLLEAQNVRLSNKTILVTYFAGIFFNNFLPANIGGEILKIYDIGRKTGSKRAVFAATFFDRLLGLQILAALAVGFSFFVIQIEELDLILLSVAGFFLLVMLGTFLMLNERSSQWLVDLAGRLSGGVISRQVQAVRDAILLYRDKIRLLRWLALLSLVIQSIRIITHYLVALSLGVTHISIFYFFIFIPILGVLMTLPISFSGFGVREWAGMVLFASVNVSAAHAVSIEFIAGILNLIAALIGGIVFLEKND